MGKLSKHPAVEDDLAEIFAYIAHRSGYPEIALEVYDTIAASFQQLANNRFLGRAYQTGIPELEGLQRFLVQRYKRRYHVFFMRTEDEVRILYVYHHARDIPERMAEDQRS